MDQLAPVIKWIKKNVFWLCCGFLSVAMIGIWFFASTTLNAQTKKRTAEVKKSITAVKAIMTVKPADITEDGAHPNVESENGMKQELAATIDSIIEAWTARKIAQDRILVWPKVLSEDKGPGDVAEVDAGQKFVKFFSTYNPPETFPEKYAAGLEFADLLELYATKIPDQMLYLCGDDILRTRWNYDPEFADQNTTGGMGEDMDGGLGGMGGGMGGMDGGLGLGGGGLGLGGGGMMGGGRGGMGMGPGAEVATVDLNKYAVIWSDVNQTLWNQKLTMFQGLDDNVREVNHPTPLQCYRLQQDLWLLEAMFRIIREVNGGSNANDLSVIKRIDHVVFGREVGGKLGELMIPDRRLAGKAPAGMGGMMGMGGRGSDDNDEEGGGLGGEDGGMGGMGGEFSRGSVPGGDSGETVPFSNVPYHLRYVDLNFEPIAADVVRSVITGKELPETNIELIVAKRVPVRIALKMDERKIAEFMAACANSPFAFEIQQVRWNKHKPGGEVIPLGGEGASTGGGGRGGMMGGMDGGMGGLGMGAGMGGMGGGGIGGTASSAADMASLPVEKRTNFDVNVEFYGIVKIYNPVRGNELKKAAGVEETVVPADTALPRP